MRLPDSVQDIADVIGRDQALWLIGQLPTSYAGSKKANKQSTRRVLYVPKRLMPKDRLVRLLGWQDACKMAQAFSGMLMQPANCAEVYRPHRDANIARLVHDGMAVKMVAEWFGLSDRTVKNIAAEIPPHDFERAANDNGETYSTRAQQKR